MSGAKIRGNGLIETIGKGFWLWGSGGNLEWEDVILRRLRFWIVFRSFITSCSPSRRAFVTRPTDYKKYMRIAPHILALILLVSCKQVDNNINNHPERDSNTTISTEKSASTITTLTKNTSNKIVLIGIIPENYTELKESPANGRKMERIIVDLDNDKKADTAFIVQNENDFVNYLLLVYLTSLNKTYHLKLIDNFSPDFNLFPVQMELRKNVLEVGYFRDGTAAFGRFFKFRFDEKKKT